MTEDLHEHSAQDVATRLGARLGAIPPSTRRCRWIGHKWALIRYGRAWKSPTGHFPSWWIGPPPQLTCRRCGIQTNRIYAAQQEES